MYTVECLIKGTNLAIVWDTAETLERAETIADIYRGGTATYVRITKD